MIALYQYFLDNGFKKTKKKAVYKYLTEDIYIEIAPERDNWKKSCDLYFYLISPHFARVMTALFKDKGSPAWGYLPRKLREDTEGGLGMVFCRFERDALQIENSLITPSNFNFSVRYFLELLNTLKTDREIYEQLYKGILRRTFPLIEGMWVYLYFANKLRFSIEKTLSEIEDNTFIYSSWKTWHLKKSMDRNVVELFKEYYENAIKQ